MRTARALLVASLGLWTALWTPAIAQTPGQTPAPDQPAAAPAPPLADEGAWAGLLRFAVRQLNAPGEFEIALGRIESRAGGETWIESLEIRDDQGVWLSATALSVVWDSSAALTGGVRFPRIAAATLTLSRAPVTRGDPPSRDDPEAGLEFAWPRAPVSLSIERLEIAEAKLGAPILGRPVAGRIAGRLIDAGDAQTVALELERTDGGPALELSANSDFNFAENRFDLRVRAAEAPGGPVAALLGAPERSGLFLELKSDGAPTAARIDLQARADDALTLRLTGSGAWQPGIALKLSGRLDAGAAAPDWARAAAAGGATLELDLAAPETGAIALNTLALRSPALALTATGQWDPNADQIALGGALSAPDLQAFAALFGLEAAAGVDAGFRASGKLSAPDARLTARLSGLKGGFGALEALSLTLTSAPDADGAAVIAGALETKGLALSDADLARAIGPTPGATLSGRWEAATRRLAIDAFAAEAAVLRLTGSGGPRPAGGGVDARLSIDLTDAAPIFALAGIDGAGRGRLGFTLTGARADGVERAEIDGALTDLRFADAALARLIGADATLKAALLEQQDPDGAGPDAKRYTLSETELRAAALGLTATGRFAPARDAVDLALDAAVRDPAAVGEALGVGLDGAEAKLALTGRLSAPNLTATARIDAPNAEGVLAARALAARLTAELRRDERTPFELSLDVEDARYETPALTKAIGPAPTLSAKGELDRAVSALRLDALALRAAAVTLDAEGRARLAALGDAPPDLDLSVDAALSDLSALSPARGAVAAAGRLSGPLADPTAALTLTSARIDGVGPRIEALIAELSAARLATAPSGRLSLSAKLAGAPLDLALAAEPAEGATRLTLERLRHRGADASGTVSLDRASGRAAGDLKLAIPNLAPFSALAGQPLQGRADAALRLGSADGAQTIALDLDAKALRLADAVEIAALDAGLSGPIDRLALRLDAASVSAGPLRKADARLRGALTDQNQTVALSALTLKNRALDLALVEPTRLRLAPGAPRLAPTKLALNGGRIDLSGTAGPTPAVELALDKIPLDILAKLDLAPVGAGTLSGRASLRTGARAAGQARFDAVGLGLGRAGDDLSDRERFDARLALDWNGRSADLDASLSPPGADPLRLTARLPVRAAPLPTLSAAAPIDGRIQWAGDAAKLMPLVPGEGVDLRGATKIDLGLAGTLAKPRLTGAATLSDGRLQLIETGTDLHALSARLTPTADGALDFALQARDAPAADAGTLSADGGVQLDTGAVEVALKAARAVLIRRDDAVARIDADLKAAVGGPSPGVSGLIRIRQAELRLIGGGVSAPPLIDVTTADEAEDRPRPSGDATPLPLDIRLEAPRRIFARGRGLDSEWGGALRIRGTAAAPEIVGDIAARRGRFEFAGKPFILTGSRVRFTGPPLPQLDVKLTRNTGQIEGEIAVTGAATTPTVALSSTPSLPEDEILPQLIFGRSLAQLTPLEAAQLASGLAALTSGKPGALDAARDLLGVDSLAVGQGDSGETTLSAGRYVAPGVFLKAQEGLDPNDRSVGVEIEVTPKVRIDGEAGAQGDVGVGVEWRKDY